MKNSAQTGPSKVNILVLEKQTGLWLSRRRGINEVPGIRTPLFQGIYQVFIASCGRYLNPRRVGASPVSGAGGPAKAETVWRSDKYCGWKMSSNPAISSGHCLVRSATNSEWWATLFSS